VLTEELIIDAKDTVLGRLATFVAKELLAGKHVQIVNAEKALISGRKKATFDHYKRWLRIRTITNPRKGLHHHKYPEDILRRTIRGVCRSTEGCLKT